MKLAHKLLLMASTISCLLFGVLIYILYTLKAQEASLLSDFSRTQAINNLNNQLNEISHSVDTDLLAFHFSHDSHIVSEIYESDLKQASLFDQMYSLVKDKKRIELLRRFISIQAEIKPARSELLSAYLENDPKKIETSFFRYSILNENAKAALNDLNQINITLLSDSFNQITAIRQALSRLILLDLILIICVIAGVYTMVKRMVISPIEDLAKSTRDVARGQFHNHIRHKSQDEIGELVTSFNIMSDRLAESYSKLEDTVKIRTQELEKFKLAVEHATDQIIMTDPDGLILYANSVLKKNTGYSPEEALGQKAGKLWGNLMPHEFYKTMWHRIKIEKKPFIGQLQNKRKSGEIYDADLHISPILDKEGTVVFFLAIEQDITKEKAIDRAKTEFVSVASHQLRTPLSAVKWASEILLDKTSGKLTKKQLDYIHEIKNGNERMIDLVNTLLNVSRIELGTYSVVPRKMNVTDIVQEVLSSMKNEIKNKHLVVSRDLGHIPDIEADPIFIHIIVQNIVTNAIKYTPDKGHITVTLSRHKDNLRFTVKDTGYGIPKGSQSSVFTKLFRAENVQKMAVDGNGLGLYITKSIVEKAVHGKIWFESEENIGTTFYIELPISGMAKKSGTKRLV